jgi:tRNA pseudouridine13 synthase
MVWIQIALFGNKSKSSNILDVACATDLLFYREYTLGGSYRKILQLPKDFSWTILRYTDPDVALAQADEDKLLGFDPPVIVEDGKFMALQIHLTLGTAAYATMALREVTKTETSSHFQSNLTLSSEDQKFKGVPASDEQEED